MRLGWEGALEPEVAPESEIGLASRQLKMIQKTRRGVNQLANQPPKKTVPAPCGHRNGPDSK